jgi:hypothetical protein
MGGSEALGTVWRWIKSHKAATALIVVLLTLVPVLPEYRIVDFAGRDEGAIRKLLCSKLPADGCHQVPCSVAIREQTEWRLEISFPQKRPLIPGLFHRRKKAYVFDYATWKKAYAQLYVGFQSISREVGKAYPPKSASCPAEVDWNEILKHVPLDELQRLTQQHRDESEKYSDEFWKELERQDALRAK